MKLREAVDLRLAELAELERLMKAPPAGLDQRVRHRAGQAS